MEPRISQEIAKAFGYSTLLDGKALLLLVRSIAYCHLISSNMEKLSW